MIIFILIKYKNYLECYLIESFKTSRIIGSLAIVYKFMEKLFRHYMNSNNKQGKNNFEPILVIDSKNFTMRSHETKTNSNHNLENVCPADNSHDTIWECNEENNSQKNFQKKIFYFKVLNELNQKVATKFYKKCGHNIFPHPIPEKRK